MNGSIGASFAVGASTGIPTNSMTMFGTTATSTQSDANYEKFTTGAVNGNSGGITSGTASSTGMATMGSWGPLMKFQVRTDTSVANMRYWFGASAMSGLSLSQNSSPGTNSSALIRYDTGQSDTDWMCVASSGAAGPNNLSTGVTVSTSTIYKITIDWTTSTQVICTVNGTTVTQTSNVDSAGTTGLSLTAMITTLTGSAAKLYLGFMSLAFVGNGFF